MTRLLRRPSALLRAAALGLVLLVPVTARADFAQGVRAYEAGDYTSAFEAWQPLAERGDVAAMRNLGHLYRWGQGVHKDIPMAMHWYRKAAETGFARAQANLAAIYLQGDDGVPVDYTEARKWFEAAAKQGHAVAQYNLGLMYELGLGVDKNDAVALGWYNNAAKAGQPDALERLSLLVMRRGGDDAKPPTAQLQTPIQIESQTDEPVASAPAVSAPPPVAAAPAADAPAAMPAMMPATMQAPAPQAETPPAAAEAPAESQKGEGFGWLFGRLYSAISSGGGVSIPDIFEGSEETPAEQPVDPAVEAGAGRKSEEPAVRP